MKDKSTEKDAPRRQMPVNRVATQARVCAHQVLAALDKVFHQHRPADRVLREIFQHNHQFGSRDRRIISETLFSVLRWWGWLRHLAPANFIQAEEDAPLHSADWMGVFSAAWILENRLELPPSVMAWLREFGLYPELFQDAKENASITERRRYLRPFFKEQPLPPMTVEALLPEWVAEELDPQAAIDMRTLVEWHQRRPPVWLRAQDDHPEQLQHEIEKQSDGSIRIVPMEKIPGAFCVKNAAANFRGLPAFREGRFEIQDLASQCVGYVCAPKKGEQWWDACAGGGGKSLHLARLMDNRGTVLATDLREEALEELRLRARRGHFDNIRTRVWKGNPVPENMRGKYDGVLVDVPCTCAGTWRRAPDGRWNTTPETITTSSQLQLRLLENASAAVRPGGTLVYSTCSMFRRENQGVVEQFLANHPEFVLDPHTQPISGNITPGMTQIWHWEADSDAMFTAKMHRRANG